MLFTSFNFGVLLALTFVLFYLCKSQKIQLIILIIASFIFYAWNFPLLLLLLVGSVAINILTGYKIGKSTVQKERRLYAILGVIANLSILSFFKYSPLIGRTFFGDASSIGEFLVAIPLPIGISFFTFQGISLVVDTFRNKDLGESDSSDISLRDYASQVALFIAFFPQLVAGPIVKAHEFLPQIRRKYFKDVDWDTCMKNLILGYFLKMVVADNLKDFTFWMEYPFFEQKSVLDLAAMLFGYSMQIFADFAGYSLIAIGIAGLFGYKLRDNFMFPYISQTFSEFWRRWHISLSTFLKEYLYIPLGGNRKGRFRTYINLMITMILGGLWHGAAWSYAVWGTYHGLALAVERFFQKQLKLDIKQTIAGRIFKGVWVFSLVTLGWLLFKLPEFTHVIKYVKCFFTNNLIGGSKAIIFFIAIYSIPIIAYHFLYLAKPTNFYNKFAKFQYVVYGMLLFMILTNSGSSGDFIYFQF